MKYRFSLIVIVLLSFFITANAYASSSGFNAYGLKGSASTVKGLPPYKAEQLVSLGSHQNVALTKQWSINFSKKATASNVAGVVVIYEDQLLPVTISGLDSKQLKLKANYQYPANAKLQLRVYLTNGKCYTVDFMTVDTTRDLTTYDASSMENAVPLYINERATAAFHGDEAYYEMNISQAGTLQIPQTPEYELIGHQIYKRNTDGPLQHIEPLVYNSSDYSVSLTPGKYVLMVHNSTGNDKFSYPLTVNFTAEASDPNDKTFSDAVTLNYGQKISTTLQTSQPNGEIDQEDYYKLNVTQDGYVGIEMETYDYKDVNVSIYNAKYEQLFLKNVSSEKSIFMALTAGTYYVKFSNATSALKYDVHYSNFQAILSSDDVSTRLAQLKKQWTALKPIDKDLNIVDNISFAPPYQVGTVRKQVLTDALNYANMMRFTANLPMSLTLDDYLTDVSQAATFVMYVNDELTHFPTKPANVSDELFEKATVGALGNISQNSSTLYGSVQAYMNDIGGVNYFNVGHRLAILQPSNSSTGFGFVKDATTWPQTSTFAAMRSHTDNYTYVLFDTITWPVKTVMPIEFFDYKSSWSITFNTNKYTLDIDDLQITMTKNGQSTVLNASNTDYFTISTSSTSNYTTLVFKPNDSVSEGDHFVVKVAGLKNAQGKPTSYQYETTFLSIQ